MDIDSSHALPDGVPALQQGATVVAHPLPIHEALARLAKRADPEAWSAILAGAGEDLRRQVARLAGCGHLADDAVQEALLQVRDHAGDFVPEPADPEGSARRWLMTIAIHAALSLRRSDVRRRAREQLAATAPVAVTEWEPGMDMERSETTERLRDALADLPDHERLAVGLRHLAGFDYVAVAERLHCPVGTAKAWVSRGLERLRGRLARSGLLLGLGAVVALLEGLEAPASAGAAGLAQAPSLLRASTTPITAPYGTHSMKGIIMASAAAVAVIATALFALSQGSSAAEGQPGPGPGPGQTPIEAREAGGAVTTASPETTTKVVSESTISTGTEQQKKESEALRAAIVRLAPTPTSGYSRSSFNHDGKLIVTTTLKDGTTRVAVGKPDGERIWEGPATTAAEKKLLPAGIGEFLAAKEAEKKRLAAAMAPRNAAIEAVVEQWIKPYAGSFKSRSTMVIDDILTVTIDRDGKPWMVAGTVAGEKRWEGPVGTPAERGLLPAEIARKLGYEKFNADTTGGGLNTKAQPEGETITPQ